MRQRKFLRKKADSVVIKKILFGKLRDLARNTVDYERKPVDCWNFSVKNSNIDKDSFQKIDPTDARNK